MTHPDTPPVFHLIAGINGAGKTSFYYDFLKDHTPGAEFVNADEMEQLRWPDAVGQHSYEAAELASRRRDELIAEGSSFVAETVFSHPSKIGLIDRARAAGFQVILYHIHVSTPELAVARVRTRVSMGGHDVPAGKVEARYPRTLELIRDAVQHADRAYVFDNSRIGCGFTHVLTFDSGHIQTFGSYLPNWVKDTYKQALGVYLREHMGGR
ncbi:MAG TPA: zeta toxin family protein [Myxococcota bacterium]|nr:zeta toxin family protein [Myxococcota bacterium]